MSGRSNNPFLSGVMVGAGLLGAAVMLFADDGRPDRSNDTTDTTVATSEIIFVPGRTGDSPVDAVILPPGLSEQDYLDGVAPSGRPLTEHPTAWCHAEYPGESDHELSARMLCLEGEWAIGWDNGVHLVTS